MNKYSPIIRSWRPNNNLKPCTSISIPNRNTNSAPESNEKPGYVIPKRIHRGPTDILQALASTIGRDPTAPHYKYHDDPYLIPNSNFKKRVYAMAQESGRKAAHWIRQENKDFFMFKVSDPPLKLKTPYINAEPQIEAFIPKTTYDENSEVTEEDLKKCLRNSLVSDAKTVYQILEAKDPESISPESRQQFLELICFFNDEDPIAEEWIEERWFRQGKWSGSERIISWKSNGLAQSIFASMKDKSPEAYCTIIQGMCKYFQAENAYGLYQECLEKNIKLNVDVYNGLISVVGFLKEGNDLRWQLILDLLNDMKSKGLKPNVRTLNSIMDSISSMNSPKGKDYCLSVLAEFNKMDVQPSLATWYHVLCVFCKDKGPKDFILHSIMNHLEGKNLTIQDPKDPYFFVTAMNVCRYHLWDLDLAKRVHALLLHGNNYNLIGDSYRESIYYRHFFTLHCRYEPLDSFIDLYYELVPHVYVPEAAVMKEVINTLDVNGAFEHYPLIWSHMLMFGYGTLPLINEVLLESMVRNLPVKSAQESLNAEASKAEKVPKKEEEIKTLGTALALGLGSVRSQYGEDYKTPTLEDNFANIALAIWTEMENQPLEKTNRQMWTGVMLGYVLQLLVRGRLLESAEAVLKKLSTDGGACGIPSTPQPLLDFAQLAISEKKPSLATPALTYLAECGFPESVEGAKSILGELLNRPQTEIEEFANQAGVVPNIAQDDPNVASLLAIINQKHLPREDSRSNDKSSDSSDSSDSDSSSDDERGN